MVAPLARLCQKHVGNDGHADRAPMVVRKVHAPDADRGSDAHQIRPRQESSFGDRAKVVDLQFDSREPSRTVEVAVEGSAHGRIGDTRRDASVQRALTVEQLGPYAALDGYTITMQTHQLESQQIIEGVPREKLLDEFVAAFGVAQVW